MLRIASSFPLQASGFLHFQHFQQAVFNIKFNDPHFAFIPVVEYGWNFYPDTPVCFPI
jgi:hypothetical protein